ncbi:hypothetical protein Peur_055514 [Populus x canadensis]
MEVYKALLIGEVASSATREKGFENDIAPRAKCEMHDWGFKNVSWLATVLALNETRPLLQMGWLQSLLSPLKKLWFRLHSTPKNRRGIYILYEDVKSCQYEDVHVLWSILVESNTPSLPSKQ